MTNATKIDKAVESISAEELEKVVNRFTLSDAIRLGSTVTTQSYDWGDGETACALTAGALAAKAAGYLK